MTRPPHPPRWADRFLRWYCNSELLEEIQGDALELYDDRLQRRGKWIADLLYIWDVLRFFRISTMRRPAEYDEPGFWGLLWNINLKLAIRHSFHNKGIFFVKFSALAICMAFSLLLTALVLNDTTYDHQYPDYTQLYRIGCHVNFQGKESELATSPLPMGPTLADEVPGIDNYTRFMILSHPVLSIDDKKFYGITCYAADENFLTLFPQRHIEGQKDALLGPNKIVLTESVARTLFGDSSALGKTVDLGAMDAQVTGIIRDLPSNTHFTFQALVSWDTFNRNDSWTNINAYTYIHLEPSRQRGDVDSAITVVARKNLEQLSTDYKFSFAPVLQRIDEINLSGFMDEDFVTKRNHTYIYLMVSVIVLLLLTGLSNYLNLALTALTMQAKTIGILKVFGGYQANQRKVAMTEAMLTLLLVIPFVTTFIAWIVTHPGLFSSIDHSVWLNPWFVAIAIGIIIVVMTGVSGLITVARPGRNSSFKVVMDGRKSSLTLRKILVAGQLAFSIIMAGLFSVVIQQFRFIEEADKGIKASDIFVVKKISSSGEHQVFENALRTLPGVEQVAASSFYPDGGQETRDVFELETPTGRTPLLLNYILAERDFPSLLEMRLVAGRFFGKDGDGNATREFIINETAAKLMGWKDPIGKRIRHPANDDKEGSEIVGVVKDFHFESMHAKIEPVIMISTKGQWNVDFIFVKANPLSAGSLLEAIDREHRKIYPGEPFEGDFLDARFQHLYQNDYELKDIFDRGLIISFLVSALGIFGLSALILSLRTREMGIRKVVGASGNQLFISHLRPFIIFLLLATTVGLPLVFLLAQKWLNNFAYHISVSPLSFILPVAGTLLVIVFASGYHALRCARVNPVDILKEE